MLIRFLAYGAVGWILEIVWTGFDSLRRKDFKLKANTSIWMFFIYGLAVFFEPVCDALGTLPVIARGGAYVFCIFAIEFFTGSVLKKINICPWDYSGSRFSIRGIIRLDYAPVWFAAGLIFERLHFMLVK